MGIREGLIAVAAVLVAAAPPAPARAQTQQAATAPAVTSSTMAAEVRARVEALKDYQELSTLYERKVAADPNWLRSAEGQAVDAQLKNWRRDAAATAIIDYNGVRILSYSIGGRIIRDTGIEAADLEKSPAFRHTMADGIARNIVNTRLDPKVQAALAAFRKESQAPAAAAGGPAGHDVSIIGVYQSTYAGMGVAIIPTTDPKRKVAVFVADIVRYNQPTARLNAAFDAAQWQKFAQIWLKARHTVSTQGGFGAEVGTYFDSVGNTQITVNVVDDGSITFVIVGKFKGDLVIGSIAIKAKDLARFDATVKQLTDYFAEAPATAAHESAGIAASDRFCAQIRAIVADAPNSFAALRGQRTRQEASQDLPPATVNHYVASGWPEGAIACEITANDTPTLGRYYPNYSCVFPIVGTDKGAATQKLAQRVAACLPDISRPTGTGLDKNGGSLSAHSSDESLSYFFLTGPTSKMSFFSIQSAGK